MSRLERLQDRIQNAIDDFSRGRAQQSLPIIRVVWGSGDGEEDAHEKRMGSWGQRRALLDFLDRNYEVYAGVTGDPDSPDTCTIETELKEIQPLPVDTRKLYNALCAPESGVSLSIFPNLDDRSRISVVGVEAEVIVETINGRILADILQKLAVSAEVVYRLLAEDDGFDHWEEDVRWLPGESTP